MNKTTGTTTNYIYVNPETTVFMGKQKRINCGVGFMLTLGVAFAAMTMTLITKQQREIEYLKRDKEKDCSYTDIYK